MNKVLLTGRLTRDPELRVLASGKNVATFSMATNEYIGNGKEKAEYHTVVTWERLAEICSRYLTKGMTVAIEGRIQTRQWDDDRGTRHWKTEIVAHSVEMLSGRRKKDYAADALAAQATALGADPDAPPAFPTGDPAGDPGLFIAHVADDDAGDEAAIAAAAEPEAEGVLAGVG
jgi:single-strand DNA-binding protein